MGVLFIVDEVLAKDLTLLIGKGKGSFGRVFFTKEWNAAAANLKWQSSLYWNSFVVNDCSLLYRTKII